MFTGKIVTGLNYGKLRKMDLGTDILLTVIRESVSLFILLVFLFFSYRLLDRLMSILEKHFGSIVECLDRIGDALSSRK